MLDVSTKQTRARFYGSAEWRAFRESILERDNYECQWCKEQGQVTSRFDSILEVDHIEELKDTDSVPEVWYEGRRLDELPNGLVSIDYNWKTKGHDGCFEGENNLDIEWFGTHKEGFRR